MSLLLRRRFMRDTYVTLLYSDGTLVMNEASSHRAANIAAHGPIICIFEDFDYNKKYELDTTSSEASVWTTNDGISLKRDVKSVVIDSPFKPKYCDFWFYDIPLLSVEGLEKLDMSTCESIYYMFYLKNNSGEGLSNLLGIESWDTSNIKNFSYAFSGRNKLYSMPVELWDTSSATTMKEMFSGCTSLEVADVSNFNVTKVTSINSMFLNCGSLHTINTSNWYAPALTNLYRTFMGCRSVTQLDLGGFVTRNVTNFGEMFSGCSNLTKILASNDFVTTSITNPTKDAHKNVFKNCTRLIGGRGSRIASAGITYTSLWIDGVKGKKGLFTRKS